MRLEDAIERMETAVNKGLLVLVLSELALVFVAACARDRDGKQVSDPSAVALGGWQRVEPGGTTRCARDGRYTFWIRKGDPKKLLVFFQRGGGCFSETTCRPGSLCSTTAWTRRTTRD